MKNFVATLCCLFSFSAFSQSYQAFIDAGALTSLANEEQKLELTENIRKVLFAYAPHVNTTEELIDNYLSNPFFKNYMPDSGKPNPSSEDLEIIKKRSVNPSSMESLTGVGLSPSSFLLGLSDFLVKRTKQELHIAFFQKFQAAIDTSQELQILFPKTAQLLGTLDKEIYRFNAFWESLREGFAEDLDGILPHLSEYVQETKHLKDENMKNLASDFFNVLDMFKSKSDPTTVIRYLGREGFFQDVPADSLNAELRSFQQNMKMMCIISEALEGGDDGYWVSPQDFRLMLKDTMHTDFFLGLIYERGREIQFNDSLRMTDHMDRLHKANSDLRGFLRDVTMFIDRGKRLKALADEMKQRRNLEVMGTITISQEEKNQEFYYFVNQSLDMVDYCYKLKKKYFQSTPKEDSIFQHYFGISKSLNQLTFEIQQRQFPIAILTSIDIIDRILPDSTWTCGQRSLMKYGSFIATAVSAKSSDEVSQAIDAFALPPGSAAIKKFSTFSIAVNAYVGVGGGYETLQTVGTSPYYALATPIGFSFSRGFGKGGALSLLVSVIDIGALTAYRFDGNNTQALPDLTFENVLAPGGYLVYGFPKLPLSFGIGAQYGPSLRSVTNGNLNITTTTGWRAGAFLAVDIPLINMYSSNKLYKNCKKQ